MQIVRPRLEALREPMGVDEPRPRFSWQLRSQERSAAQSAYRIEVHAGDTLVWDSGKVVSRQNSQVEYAGAPLKPRTHYWWRVRVWDERGLDAGASRIAHFETGLMGKWRARWIAHPKQYEPGKPLGVVRFSRAFEVKEPVESARLYVSALGVYAVSLNGARAHDARLCPGPTSTKRRVHYQAFDVTKFLREGNNEICADVAGGWYTGAYAHALCAEKCGPRQALIAQLYIRYTSGEEDAILTDSHWQADASGPYRMADLAMGVWYDSTIAPKNPVNAYLPSIPKTLLTWPAVQPIVFRETLSAQNLWTAPNGDKLVDFGQNIAGVVRFTVRGERGREVAYDCAEVLDAQGNFYRENYRSARAEVRYVLSGGGAETFTPDFTYMGFRYIRLKNWPEGAKCEDFTALVLRTDLEENAGFECSDERVNQLYHNALWTMRSNLVGVLTDAPERDERFGWTSNYLALSNTLCLQMNAAAMLSDWLCDLAIEQRENGAIPCAIPNCLSDDLSGSALSDDAVVTVPWALYKAYGNVRMLEKHYPCIKKWIEFISSRVRDGLWPVDYQYGDWLALDARANSCIGVTDVSLIASAAYARAADLAARIADVLDRDYDARNFRALHKKIKRAYQREFITATGRLAVNTQTAHILTLRFDLCEEEHRDRIANDLFRLIEENGDCLTTGSAGTPSVLSLLTSLGRHDLAARVLFRDDMPSWLYAVRHGATTIWERWDGIQADGTFANPEFNSFNHPLGSCIAAWLVSCVAGIGFYRSPMYADILLHPRFTEGMSFASGWHRTPYGVIRCGWRLSGVEAQVEVSVPVSCEALVILENAWLGNVREKSGDFLDSPGVKRAWQSDNDVFVRVDAGNYEFVWRFEL